MIESTDLLQARIEPKRAEARPWGHDGARYGYADGVYELTLLDRQFNTRRAAAVRQGEAEFALVDEGPVLLLCYRFGDALPWGCAPYEAHAAVARDGGLPMEHTPFEERALLHIELIDARHEARRETRNVTLSLDFTRALNEAIRDQLRTPFDPASWQRTLATLRRRCPTINALVARASVRSFGTQ
jgi:hypothetical protein